MLIFGHSFYSHMKRRLAKKKLSGGWGWRKMQKFANFKVGDLIRTCNGLNEVVLEAEPNYKHTSKGFVLSDVDLVTTHGCCSLYHCCDLPISHEEAVQYREDILKRYAEHDPWGFVERYAHDNMIINLDGTYSYVEPKPE
jgi:hypothetical protein